MGSSELPEGSSAVTSVPEHPLHKLSTREACLSSIVGVCPLYPKLDRLVRSGGDA
jgi:hypothetical protein